MTITDAETQSETRVEESTAESETETSTETTVENEKEASPDRTAVVAGRDSALRRRGPSGGRSCDEKREVRKNKKLKRNMRIQI